MTNIDEKIMLIAYDNYYPDVDNVVWIFDSDEECFEFLKQKESKENVLDPYDNVFTCKLVDYLNHRSKKPDFNVDTEDRYIFKIISTKTIKGNKRC